MIRGTGKVEREPGKVKLLDGGKDNATDDRNQAEPLSSRNLPPARQRLSGHQTEQLRGCGGAKLRVLSIDHSGRVTEWLSG